MASTTVAKPPVADLLYNKNLCAGVPGLPLYQQCLQQATSLQASQHQVQYVNSATAVNEDADHNIDSYFQLKTPKSKP